MYQTSMTRRELGIRISLMPRKEKRLNSLTHWTATTHNANETMSIPKEFITSEKHLPLEFSVSDLKVIKASLLQAAVYSGQIHPARIAKIIQQEIDGAQ